MAPQKRKRPQDEPPPRRATRQHPDEPERQLRSGRVRAGATEQLNNPHTEPPVARSARIDASKQPPTRRPGRPPTRNISEEKVLKENIQPQSSIYDAPEDEDEEEIEEVELLRPSTPSPSPSPSPPPPPPQPLAKTNANTSAEPTQRRLSKSFVQHQQSQHSRATQTTATDKIATPKRPHSADKLSKPPPTPRSDRNIDKVVLGDICFKAWYPSYYGKEVLGDISNTTNAGGKDRQGSKDRDGGGKIGGRIGGGKRNPPPMLERLYVCPCCFKYSRELVMWWEHVRICERTFRMPGTKVYTHPKGRRTVKIAATEGVEKVKGRGRKRSDAGAHANASASADKMITDEGEWSVWEVDGEKDGLFCQNLSLFAKLFLDNKSVFFDVTGFNYFLLVYTPPQPSDAQQPPSTNNTHLNEPLSQPHPSATNTSNPHHYQTPESRPQVVGFFSKEKLSWDNNNLACILVFPPWQRKGLGALLMGVSYEISRREGILGGPEKPISELGRKGYKRFWAGEIARWLLGLDISKPQKKDDEEGEGDDADGGQKKEGADEKGTDGEYLISVDQCSKATWIVPEDCLAVLRDMDIVEEICPNPTDVAGESAEQSGSGSSEEGEAEPKEARAVPKVRLDKEAVRRWVQANKIDLTQTCDPNGFIEGYAVGKNEEEEVDEA
ncbi:acyl-CoA N-acyltransferase [Rostrohypoxylon terebratum]|nr:acyl-CoA N-acyltransferase [Rostrohypoxylon terebratum]